MKKILQKFFRGYVVLEEIESPINGKIQAREDLFGKKRLVVGGISQSGEEVEQVWKKALKAIENLKFKIENCLILGLGAGTAAKLVFQTFSGVKITSVEIDPEMIRLGKKYFGLDKIPNLKIGIANAISAISHMPYALSKCDLILVDLYLGDQVPKGAETEEFIKQVKQCLWPSGWVIFNRLYYKEKKEKTDEFGEKLKKFFPQIEAKKVTMNKLFLCQK